MNRAGHRRLRTSLAVNGGLILLMLLLLAVGPNVRSLSRHPDEYTDAEAESIAHLLTALPFQLNLGRKPVWQIIKMVGIDTAHLRSFGGPIGNCYAYSVYALSANYVLFTDDNACSGGLVAVRRKPSCLSGGGSGDIL